MLELKGRSCLRPLLIVIGIIVMSWAGQTTARAGMIEEIRALYKTTNKTIEYKKAKKVLFYTAAEGWKEAKSVDQKKFTDIDTMALFERHYLYLYQDRVIKVEILFETPSGDWVLYRDYYFFKDGRTAFVFDSQRTFQGYDFDNDRELPEGPYVVEKRMYYDRRGKEIRVLKKAFIKSTKKEIPEKFVRQVSQDVPPYPAIRSFPYYTLLKTKYSIQ